MTNSIQTQKVPKLRFNIFTNNWKQKSLGELIDRLDSGVSVNAENRKKIDNEYGILKTSCVNGGTFYPDEHKVILPSELSRAKLHPQKDTIIISRMNTPTLVGESGYVDKMYPNLFVPDRLWTAIINPKEANTKWLSYVLSSKKLKTMLTNIATGTSNSMKNISQPSFLALRISTPQVLEQEKIAGFLSVVDDKISKLHAQKELLEKYKKAILRPILNKELRFKNKAGEHYPDWKQSRLAEVLIKVSRKNKHTEFELVQSVSNTRGFVDQVDLFNSRVIASKDLSNYYVIDRGTFAYNPSRIDIGSLAYKSDNRTSVVSPLYVCFKAGQDLLTDRYLLYWFESTNFIRQMNNSFEGSVRHSLSYNSLQKMTIGLPGKEEQQKIADFLTAIDDKINLTKKELEQAKTFKKALLQQMFI